MYISPEFFDQPKHLYLHFPKVYKLPKSSEI
jgi:hypothetical protein